MERNGRDLCDILELNVEKWTRGRAFRKFTQVIRTLLGGRKNIRLLGSQGEVYVYGFSVLFRVHPQLVMCTLSLSQF